MPGFLEPYRKIRSIILIFILAGVGLYLAMTGIEDVGFLLNCQTVLGKIERVDKRVVYGHVTGSRFNLFHLLFSRTHTPHTQYLTTYSYDVGGFNYRHEDSRIDSLPVGVVQVYYNRKNPAQCHLSKPSPALDFFIMVLAFGWAALIGWGLFTNQKSWPF